MKYEYKVLDHRVTEVTDSVGSLGISLAEAMAKGHSHEVEGVLNALDEEGWEPVLLQPPYIFRKLAEN